MNAPDATPDAAPPSPHVLIVEDEPKLAELLRDYLLADGCTAEIVDDGERALARVRDGAPPPDAILLDLMLPGRDGVSVCRAIRALPDPRAARVPILMVTARVEEMDRILGLELGADDYICKPFSPREVVTRVKAVLRRMQPLPLPVDVPVSVAAPLLQLDDERFEARLRGALLPLTPVEFRLLRALHARPGRVLSRAQLIDAAYLDHRVVSDRTVDSHIKNLRRKLAACGDGADPIVAVYGMGYKLDAAGAGEA
ncbi:MAG: response regulator [Lysobacteraceae bacterium]